MKNSSTANPPSHLFGLETQFENSSIVLMSVPWEVTTSYGAGASLGSEAILKASPQLDLYDINFGNAAKQGLHLDQWAPDILEKNKVNKKLAQQIINEWDEHGELSNSAKESLIAINKACDQVNQTVLLRSKEILSLNKIPALIGGDHSTPYGLIEALSQTHDGEFGILHIDAHADLRKTYQGFEHSHASIMRNVMELPYAPAQLTQVGIRDFCEEEWQYIQNNESRITTFFDSHLKRELFSGTSWKEHCEQITNTLPENVYISFDIDGLSPDNCPNTGTPVPGGISFNQATYLIETVARSNRKIIGFDLVEVAPGKDEWDGNIGARLAYQLCGWALVSNGQQPVQRSLHG